MFFLGRKICHPSKVEKSSICSIMKWNSIVICHVSFPQKKSSLELRLNSRPLLFCITVQNTREKQLKGRKIYFGSWFYNHGLWLAKHHCFWVCGKAEHQSRRVWWTRTTHLLAAMRSLGNTPSDLLLLTRPHFLIVRSAMNSPTV
jgi:hypothetical protein